MIQLFYCYLTCPVKPFLQAIDELKQKWDRYENVTSQELMNTALLSYNTLQLEGRWITDDPIIKAMNQITNEIKSLVQGVSPQLDDIDREIDWSHEPIKISIQNASNIKIDKEMTNAIFRKIEVNESEGEISTSPQNRVESAKLKQRLLIIRQNIMMKSFKHQTLFK